MAVTNDPAAEKRRSLPVLGARALVPTRVASGPPPRSVRVSVTDRCDFACTYCRPSRNDGYADGRLMTSAWKTMFEALRRAGVRRVRLTGGEPLVHPEIVSIVAHLASLGFEDLALTTNASQLAKLARPLRDAGLHRINVSIDTLDPDRFRAVTRGGDLGAVLAGIEAASEAGFPPIKLNTVVLRGVNDEELERILLWAWERRMLPRFLEVMPIAEGAKLVADHLVTAAEMRRALAAHLTAEEAVTDPGLGPAKYVRARHDPSLRVGFITGTSDTFCETCDRLRVSSTGVLRPCLATDDGVDAGAPARAGDAAAIVEDIGRAWAMKPDGTIWKGCTEETAAGVSMRAIGG
ncbi:GTP 3',8-cyclase MoaA [Polyangium spumosum]|uniref:GTP 3',8-cyclase MoaA n=1 Tax=Polyangium spumosum TaxID=889282 RepID=A0A6N7PG87_9BACT|nr:GTP 3',8-cyclase MoaA [Polyangium spumosum]MRG91053.1 GTP 3',8-cyclase MoaA [Polyangium spumosum]